MNVNEEIQAEVWGGYLIYVGAQLVPTKINI